MNYVYFVCGITFYPETPTKVRQIKSERNYFSRSCEKSKWNPSNDQPNCSFVEKHTSNIFLNACNLRNMVPTAPLSLNPTNDSHSMYNEYPQAKTHQPRTDSYPVLSCLRMMDSKRKWLRVSLALFQRKHITEGQVNNTIATVEELVDLWKPGAKDGFRRLRWTVFVFRCNYLFRLFDSHFLLVQDLLFFLWDFLFFCFLSFMSLSEK